MQEIKILYVGDNCDDFTLLEKHIGAFEEENNYQAVWINCYSEAINALLKNHVSLAIINKQLEGVSSYALFREAVNSRCTPPLILLYDSDNDPEVSTILSLPLADKIKKGDLEGNMLLRRLQYALKKQKEINILKQDELKFRTLFERNQDPLFIIKDELISDANDAMLRLMGMDLSGLKRTAPERLFPNRSEFLSFMQNLENNGTTNNLQIILKGRAPGYISCNISCFVQISQHGDSQHLYCLLRNIQTIAEEYVQQDNCESEMLSIADEIRTAALELQNNPRRTGLLDILKANSERINKLSAFLSINSTAKPY